MSSSIVAIESIVNNSFGTGFVICNDEKGVYILTCAHVVDDVKIPIVENVLAKVVAEGSFIDMAILYVSRLNLSPLTLQIGECNSSDVKVIGFSTFNQKFTQKKYINATLYRESIELHSKKNELFYRVRKIKAKDGFNFDRGNSGSPVICKNSGKVIGIISNKEGSSIAYAIDISYLREVWKDMPHELLEREAKTIIGKNAKSKSSIKGYILLLVVSIATAIAVFLGINKSSPILKKPPIYSEMSQSQLETKAFQALINRDYRTSMNIFFILNRRYPKAKSYYEIAQLLKKHINSLDSRFTQRFVIREIIKRYSWKIPKETIEALRKELKDIE